MKANIDDSIFDGKNRIISVGKKNIPATSDLTLLMRHGGAHSLLDRDAVNQRIQRVRSQHTKEFENVDTNSLADEIVKVSENFFFRLVDKKPYNLNSSLISHISLYSIGRAFSQPKEEINPNYNIPTFLTFVGQFIDHDLTLNMIDLIGRAGNPAREEKSTDPPQIGDPDSTDVASPLIDLDSIYGTRTKLNMGDIWDIFDINTGKIFLHYNSEGSYFDYCRIKSSDALNGKAFVNDQRNDENQIISQIQLMIIRLHNTLASDPKLFPPPTAGDAKNVIEFINKVRTEVVRIWQNFLWNVYLPKTVNADALLDSIKMAKNAFIPIKMPHEFSICFRMGHSQLRPSYRLNAENVQPIPLFANQVIPISDLRGNRPLEKEHVIDWTYFLRSDLSKQTSNKIDSKVTSAVFDLPESAIPDNVKGVTNLPQRNLMRSEQVRLACGEDLVTYINTVFKTEIKSLTPEQIEVDPANQCLFQIDNDGEYKASNPFRTPLWYYILKEAEILEGGLKIGPVGGRIIGTVITTGIWNTRYSFNNPKYANNWKPSIPLAEPDVINFEDIVNYVQNNSSKVDIPECKN